LRITRRGASLRMQTRIAVRAATRLVAADARRRREDRRDGIAREAHDAKSQ